MLTFEHGNRENTGSQLAVDMKPSDGVEDGKFTLSISKQSAVGFIRPDGTRVLPEFDGNEATISLNAKQATHLLFVLEGKTNRVNLSATVLRTGKRRRFFGIMSADVLARIW